MDTKIHKYLSILSNNKTIHFYYISIVKVYFYLKVFISFYQAPNWHRLKNRTLDNNSAHFVFRFNFFFIHILVLFFVYKEKSHTSDFFYFGGLTKNLFYSFKNNQTNTSLWQNK